MWVWHVLLHWHEVTLEREAGQSGETAGGGGGGGRVVGERMNTVLKGVGLLSEERSTSHDKD
jgi:hypothetical protein